MRIIQGSHKGKFLKAPKNLPVRPTTDFAKEGLFNIMNHHHIFDEIRVIDLFAGTGNISYEFLSRGAVSGICVDGDYRCCKYIKETIRELKYPAMVVKSDVFKYLERCKEKANIIFADPPYEMENLDRIHELVFQNKLLEKEGWLIIEHNKSVILSHLSNFVETRKYGNVNFSIFAN